MTIKIKYIGHSSFIINLNKKNILTDPYFSSEKKGNYRRLINSAIDIDKVPKIDTILISHEHFDSFDINDTNYLAKKFHSKIVAHQSVLNKIDCDPFNKISMDEYENKLINNINYCAYPAHHPTSFFPLSYKIGHKNNNIYFAGDTFMTNEQEQIKADIAFLPIGGKTTMDISSAAKIAKKIKPKYLIPMAYNTFENIKQNPLILKEKLDKTKYDIRTIILNPGKTLTIK
jgi:L-ascorbate metabolism protein UlaG (beta-lactamase superfamily)